MRKLVPLAVLFVFAAFITPKAHAIIFLPALLLIPIAKIVAIIIGGLSLPALGVGALWSNLFKKSLKRTIVVIAIMMVIIALILILFLKLHNPDRPLF
jgi:hypothetical protein